MANMQLQCINSIDKSSAKYPCFCMLNNQTVYSGKFNSSSAIEPDAEEFLSGDSQLIKDKTKPYMDAKLRMDKKIRLYLLIVFSIIMVVSMVGLSLQYAKFDSKVKGLQLSKSESEWGEKISEMMQRPAFYRNRIVQQPNDQVPSPLAYWAYRLYLNVNEPGYAQVEYYYYNSKYQLDGVVQQLPMCIISAGRNLESHSQRYKLFLDSINRQNYSNYKLIFTDDGSDDGTVDAFKAYLANNYPILSFKTKIIRNTQRQYALRNKDIMIRQQCQHGDIIVDIDADDQLIGRQALKVYNSFYINNSQLWLLFSNNINFYEQHKEPLKGASTAIKPQFFRTKRLRIEPFRIMHLRSFRRQLFMKIPQEYFMDKNTHEYHKHISDGFIYIALAELAGENRVKYVDEIFYYYYRDHRSTNAEEKKQCSLQFKLEIPFQSLQSISDTPKRADLTYSQTKIDRITKRNQHVYSLLANYQKFQQFDTLEDFEVKQDLTYYKYITNRFDIPPSLRPSPQVSHQELIKKVYFTYNMQKEYDSKDGNLAQYYYFNKNYQIGKFVKQQQICVVSINNAKQFYMGQNYKKFIDSIARQNYTNYKIFFINHYQDEGIPFLQPMSHYLRKSFPWMKFDYVNKGSKIASKNRGIDKLIRYSCPQRSIVVMLDPLCELAGRQTFKLINAKFHDKNTQISYSHSFRLVDIQSKYQKQAKLIYSLGKNQLNSFVNGQLQNWMPPQLLMFRKEAYLSIVNQPILRSLPDGWISWILMNNSNQETVSSIQEILIQVKHQQKPLTYSTYVSMCENVEMNCHPSPANRKQTVESKVGDIMGQQNKSK